MSCLKLPKIPNSYDSVGILKDVTYHKDLRIQWNTEKYLTFIWCCLANNSMGIDIIWFLQSFPLWTTLWETWTLTRCRVTFFLKKGKEMNCRKILLQTPPIVSKKVFISRPLKYSNIYLQVNLSYLCTWCIALFTDYGHPMKA